MRRIRVGIIGLGGIAQMMHLPHLTEYDSHFEVVAAADTHAPTLTAVADHFHIPQRYTNYHDLLNQSGVEAVLVLHGGSHHDSVIAALHAGKDVFAEKPLAWNVREVEEIAAVLAQTDRILQVGYHKRYDPGFLYAREQVKAMKEMAFARITVLHPDDGLGWSTHRVRRGDGNILEGHRSPASFADIVAGGRSGLAGGALAPMVDEALGARKDDPSLRLAYGMMTVSLIHQVYTLWGFFGAPVRVISTDIWREGLAIHSVIEYPENLRVTLDWHFLTRLKDYKEEYAFFGDDQRVYLTFPSPYLKNFPTPVVVQGHDEETAWEKRIIVNYDEAFRNEMLAFHSNIVERTRPETGIEEAVAHAHFIQQMIDAAR